MNTIIILNITTGKMFRTKSVERAIEYYCALPLSKKLHSFVLGLKEEALDYPGMMTFMLDYSNGKNELSELLKELEEEGEVCSANEYGM